MKPESATPVPCRCCGAPMVEDPTVHANLDQAVVVRCTYCGSTEGLPADQAQRVTALRRRLMEMRAAQAALEGPAIAIARMAETYPKSIAPGIFLMLGITALTSIQRIDHAYSLPATGAVRINALISAAANPLWVLFVLTSVFGGTILALGLYAKELRPALEARPPREGNSYRCRGCGGDIEAGSRHGAFVTCGYCGAENLLGKTSAARRAAQLDREIEEYRARAAGQAPVLAGAAERYQRRVYGVMGVVVVANVVFWLASSALLEHLATTMQ